MLILPDAPKPPVITIVPVPVDVLLVPALAVTCPEASKVVNAPVVLVVAPTVVLFIEPPEITGDEIVGVVLNTKLPVPVSSEMTPANCAEVVAAN